jgi:hypothetical protein
MIDPLILRVMCTNVVFLKTKEKTEQVKLM